jgi:hypothetical protein
MKEIVFSSLGALVNFSLLLLEDELSTIFLPLLGEA